jgi:hypothetical protein
MTSNVNNLSHRVDRMYQQIEIRKRPKLIHCSGEVASLLAELEQQIANDDKPEEDTMTPEEFELFCIEGKEVLDAAVRDIEQRFNVRFVD